MFATFSSLNSSADEYSDSVSKDGLNGEIDDLDKYNLSLTVNDRDNS